LHSEGLTLSPYTVRETFALLKAGDAAGVKLRTPYGPVWTDAAGRAVVASVPAYRNTRVEIDTASLARNVDVLNGYREIAAARGSVQRLEFQMATSRRVLLHAHTADDQVVGKGFGVFDELGRYVTSVLDDGRIFLSDIQADAALHVQKADGSRCHLTFELAEEADPDELYESASARCSEA
jgi:outer membrane usher protein FimD/PapC